MASKVIYKPDSGTYSAKGIKFKFKVVASMTTSRINVSVYLVITNRGKNNHGASCKIGSSKEIISAVGKKAGTFEFPIGATYWQQKVDDDITFYYLGRTVTIEKNTISYTGSKPSSPSSITAERVNDVDISVTVKGNHLTTVPTNKIDIEQCEGVLDVNNFSAITSSPFSITYDEDGYAITQHALTNIEAGKRYWFRARTYNTLSEKYSNYVYTSKPVYTRSNDSAIDTSSLSATRISNSQVNLAWSISSVSYVAQNLVNSFDVYRKENGGAYKKIGSVEADAQHTAYSYSDKTCKLDSYYEYGIKCKGNGSSAEEITEIEPTIYMTPCKPQKLNVYVDANNYANLDIYNISNAADVVCIEKKLISSSAWVSEEVDYPVAHWVDSDVLEAGEVKQYRIRNKCSDSSLVSADQYSEYCYASGDAASGVSTETKSPPNAPTLTNPVNGSYCIAEEESVLLQWVHNSTDGSAQTAANIQYKVNNGGWVTVTETTQSRHTLSISNLNPNDIVTWKVQTKGGHANYSPYSGECSFTIKAKPGIVFTSPLNGAAITELPVNLAWIYTDLSGTLQSLTVEIRKDGKLKKTYSVPVGQGTSGTYTYSLASYMFENDSDYTIRATAASSTGLASTDDISITTQYEVVSLDGGYIPSVEYDDDGIAYITIERDVMPDGQGIVPEPLTIISAHLYRYHDGEHVLVASDAKEGMTYIDKYAPINVAFAYELLMVTDDDDVSIVSAFAKQESAEWFVYWGDNIARAKWNPTGTVDMSRPEKKRIRYSGRQYPVTYDQDAIEETFGFTADILDRKERDAFKQMMRDGGAGIWKSGDGDCYDADFEFSYSAEFKNKRTVWNASLSVTRKDGGDENG